MIAKVLKYVILFLFIGTIGYFLVLLIGIQFYADAHGERYQEAFEEYRNGDLIFQISQSSQSRAIQEATGSKYSHMGIIYLEGQDVFVYEAIQPVKLTPLNSWIDRGENKHYVVKRLKNADQIMNPEVFSKMKAVGERFNNKDYDLYFEWSDDRIYCSELVWKIYDEGAQIQIGDLQRLDEFNLMGEIVSQKLEERYGDNIPWDEQVISPGAMFNSNLLVEVKRNN